MNPVIFGPVPSRRLGHSLGINNIPPKKCSYSCVYCQVGNILDMRVEREDFYKTEDIVDGVKERPRQLKEKGEPIVSAIFLVGGLQAFYYLEKYEYQWVVIAVLLTLAVIFLVFGIFALVSAVKDARRKDRESKAAKVHEVLKESLKNVCPEWMDEQVEIAAKRR